LRCKRSFASVSMNGNQSALASIKAQRTPGKRDGISSDNSVAKAAAQGSLARGPKHSGKGEGA
jgi:hypothetical protein